MDPILLPSQHASSHDLPDDPGRLDAVLAAAAADALARYGIDTEATDPMWA